MKSIRVYLVVAVMAASAASAGAAFAGTGCQDDPERCMRAPGETGLGAAMSRRCAAGPQATTASLAPARSSISAAVAGGAAALSGAAHRAAPPHKYSNKPARVAPSAPAPATPGMGMLLKLSNGGGGDVSLFPSRPADNTGASWVL